MFKSLDKLREERQELLDHVDAIVALAREENRDLTDEETAEIDSITAGDKNKLTEIDAKIERLERIDAKKKEAVKNRVADRFEDGRVVDSESRFVIPASAKKTGSVKHFTGPDAEKNAYIAGHFGLAVINKREASFEALESMGFNVRAAMTTDNNEKGGYLVPSPLESAIVTLVEQWGVFRQNVGNVWDLTNGNRAVPKHGTDFTAYWVGENQEITPSDAALKLVQLNAKKLAVLGRVSNEMFEDPIVSFGDYLTGSIARAAAYAEDNAGFNGDGTSAYGGIVGLKGALQAGSIATALANDNTLAELTVDPIHDAMGKLPNYEGIMPKWYMHKSVWENAFKRLAFANGDPTHYQSGMGLQFMGYPVVFVNVMPQGGPTTDLASTIVAYYGDLAMTAAMGEARGLSIAASDAPYFTADATAIRGTRRLDIVIHETGTASTAGAMVGISMNTA
jgi:HK97 family phage major capsid protein